MKEYQSVLLKLLQSSLFQVENTLPDNIDWNEVLEESRKQAVTALCLPSLPGIAAPLFMNSMMQSKAHFMQLLYEQDQVLSLLSDNDVTALVLKGTAAAMYYPDPLCRSMGDVDILVPIDCFDKSNDLLKEHGYTYIDEYYRHSEYEKNGIIIEVHQRYSFDDSDIEALLCDAFENKSEQNIKGHTFYSLPVYKNGLVLLDHMRHHFVDSGLGLRHLIDWTMFVYHEMSDDVWNDGFGSLLEKANLVDFAKAVTKCAQIYLGLPTHYAFCSDVELSLAEEVIEQFFQGGNLGIKNDLDTRNTMEAAQQLKKNGFFKGLQKAGVQNWKAAQKHSFLRPFAWLYQLFRYVGKGIVAVFSGKNIAGMISSGNEKADLFYKLGIK